jgi:hypothetical protein
MKLYLGLILLFNWALVYGYEVQISKMNPTANMDNHFSLESNLDQQIILDCQSFIQGLTLGLTPEEKFYFLEPYECEDLSMRISGSLRQLKKHCLDVDDIIRSDYTCH